MSRVSADGDQEAALQAVREAAERCFDHLRSLALANARIDTLARSGDPLWSQVAIHRYNQTCRDRGSDAAITDDAFLTAIRSSTDLKAVCDTRWLLGEAVDVLRDRVGRLNTIPAPFDDFERSIRQAVTDPDRSPGELAAGIDAAIALGTRAIGWAPKTKPEGREGRTVDDDPKTVRTDVVILVHGIRDFALWQNSVRTPLKAAGFEVEPTNYGRLNLIRFLMPIFWFRKAAVKAIEKQIRMVQLKHPGKRISVIAHSFGTYVIASLLRNEFDFRFHRVIFCGSVVPHEFEFEHYINRFQPDLLNEVGTADIWPAVAESVTRGYGSAGSYGFNRPFVTDRWHNGADHGFFLTPAFAKAFWIPFLESGTVEPGSDPAEEPRWWVKAISVFKLKYVILIALAAALIAAVLAAIAE